MAFNEAGMILDTSALIAILQKEPGWEQLVRRIDLSPAPAIGAPSLVEAGLVLTRRVGRDAGSLIDDFLRDSDIETLPFTEEHYRIAVDAFQRYGKGRHPAALNFGDCLSYAAARLSGMRLLFTGDDFSKTDIPRAK